MDAHSPSKIWRPFGISSSSTVSNSASKLATQTDEIFSTHVASPYASSKYFSEIKSPSKDGQNKSHAQSRKAVKTTEQFHTTAYYSQRPEVVGLSPSDSANNYEYHTHYSKNGERNWNSAHRSPQHEEFYSSIPTSPTRHKSKTKYHPYYSGQTKKEEIQKRYSHGSTDVYQPHPTKSPVHLQRNYSMDSPPTSYEHQTHQERSHHSSPSSTFSPSQRLYSENCNSPPITYSEYKQPQSTQNTSTTTYHEYRPQTERNQNHASQQSYYFENNNNHHNFNNATEDGNNIKFVSVFPLKAAETVNQDCVVCSNCGIDETTLWRRNKERKFVCNACGLYERKYHRPRPPKISVSGKSSSRKKKGNVA
eukprot:Awhi_evm1s10161